MERSRPQRKTATVSSLARVGGRSERVSVTEISLDECKIVTSFGFVGTGEAISLTFGDMRIFGTVTWQEAREVRLRFRSRLHPAIIAHLGMEADGPSPQANTLADHVRRAPPARAHAMILACKEDVARFFDGYRLDRHRADC